MTPAGSREGRASGRQSDPRTAFGILHPRKGGRLGGDDAHRQPLTELRAACTPHNAQPDADFSVRAGTGIASHHAVIHNRSACHGQGSAGTGERDPLPGRGAYSVVRAATPRRPGCAPCRRRRPGRSERAPGLGRRGSRRQGRGHVRHRASDSAGGRPRSSSRFTSRAASCARECRTGGAEAMSYSGARRT